MSFIFKDYKIKITQHLKSNTLKATGINELTNELVQHFYYIRRFLECESLTRNKGRCPVWRAITTFSNNIVKRSNFCE